jgi:3-(3-hydroxy-phenyl)propionate hydroxylase
VKTVEPVLVVGAGPVGMAAAAYLAIHGIRTEVFEAEPHPSTEWRASTFHPPTLELLEELGILEKMLEIGMEAPLVQFRDRTKGVVAEFDYSLLAGDTPYPFRLQLAQNKVVDLLVSLVEESPTASMHFRSRAIDVENTDDGAVLSVETPDGVERVEGGFVLAGDGASSIIRKSLDIDFPGMTYERRFLIVTTGIEVDEYLPGIADVNYVADPEEFALLLHTADGWRIVFSIPAEESDESAMSHEVVQRRLRGIVPIEGEVPVVHRRIYSVHQRVAETFRKGSVILMGDAAHINSPMGGLGLNSGIHDAFDIGRRLVRIAADPTVDVDLELDTYSRLRQAVALEDVNRLTHRNTLWMMSQDLEMRRELDAQLRTTAADPGLAREWLLENSLLAAVRSQRIGAPPP